MQGPNAFGGYPTKADNAGFYRVDQGGETLLAHMRRCIETANATGMQTFEDYSRVS